MMGGKRETYFISGTGDGTGDAMSGSKEINYSTKIGEVCSSILDGAGTDGDSPRNMSRSGALCIFRSVPSSGCLCWWTVSVGNVLGLTTQKLDAVTHLLNDMVNIRIDTTSTVDSESVNTTQRHRHNRTTCSRVKGIDPVKDLHQCIYTS